MTELILSAFCIIAIIWGLYERALRKEYQKYYHSACEDAKLWQTLYKKVKKDIFDKLDNKLKS